MFQHGSLVGFPSKMTTHCFLLFGMNILIWLQQMFRMLLFLLSRIFTRLANVISFLWKLCSEYESIISSLLNIFLTSSLEFFLECYFAKNNVLVLKLFWSNLMEVLRQQLWLILPKDVDHLRLLNIYNVFVAKIMGILLPIVLKNIVLIARKNVILSKNVVSTPIIIMPKHFILLLLQQRLL